MKRRAARAFAVVCIALLPEASRAQQASGTPAEASTEQVARCVARHESARQLRLSEQWLDARAAMTECAVDRCPLAIGADCRAWLEELNRTLPTLLVLLERGQAGSPEHPTSVELDGRTMELPDPPTPIELLPGRHHLRVVFASQAPVERDFALEKGEKNHLERIGALSVSPPPPRAPISPPPLVSTRPIPGSMYLLSAGALAAFAGSTAFLVSALRTRNEARATCAPTCDPSLRRSIETRLVLADASAGVGLSLAAWAIYVFVRRPTMRGEAFGDGPVLQARKDRIDLSWQSQF